MSLPREAGLPSAAPAAGALLPDLLPDLLPAPPSVPVDPEVRVR